MGAVGSVDLEELMSKVESAMRRSDAQRAENAAKASSSSSSSPSSSSSSSSSSGQGQAQGDAARSGAQANEAANQKWQGFQPAADKASDPKMPRKQRSSCAGSGEDPTPSPDAAQSDPAAKNAIVPAADPAKADPAKADPAKADPAKADPAAKKAVQPAPAAAEQAKVDPQAQQKALRETSAPSKLDKLLDKNPDIKTNQDLINHFYEKGGGSWEGASGQAKKAGVTMTELVRDRHGDARKTAEARRTGQAAPSSSSPSRSPSPSPSGAERPMPGAERPKPGAVDKPAASSPAAGPERTGQQRTLKPYRPVDEQKLRDMLPPQAKQLAKSFIDAGRKNNLDPVVLAAIAKHETGNFTSSAFRNKHNAMGISGSGGPKRFASAAQSVEQMARTLGSPTGPYRSARTIAEVARIYSPTRGATNDPGHLNHYWPAGVAKFADEFARHVRPDALQPAA